MLFQVLTALDAKLDGVINTAAGVAGAPAAFLSGNNGGSKANVSTGGKRPVRGSGAEFDHVVAAKNAYLRTIEDAVLLVKVPVAEMSASVADHKCKSIWRVIASARVRSHAGILLRDLGRHCQWQCCSVPYRCSPSALLVTFYARAA